MTMGDRIKTWQQLRDEEVDAAHARATNGDDRHDDSARPHRARDSVNHDGAEIQVDALDVQRLQTSNHATIPDGLRWLETLVADYRKILLNEPFYQIATTATTIQDFAWARQLLHHSANFPQVLALRRDLNYNHPHASRYRDFFAQHVIEEEGHADMLKDWLIQRGLVPLVSDLPCRAARSGLKMGVGCPLTSFLLDRVEVVH